MLSKEKIFETAKKYGTKTSSCSPSKQSKLGFIITPRGSVYLVVKFERPFYNWQSNNLYVEPYNKPYLLETPKRNDPLSGSSNHTIFLTYNEFAKFEEEFKMAYKPAIADRRFLRGETTDHVGRFIGKSDKKCLGIFEFFNPEANTHYLTYAKEHETLKDTWEGISEIVPRFVLAKYVEQDSYTLVLRPEYFGSTKFKEGDYFTTNKGRIIIVGETREGYQQYTNMSDETLENKLVKMEC